MLSRIAESLYWMGRYLERADDTARVLDTHVHRVVAESGDENVGASLLRAVGLRGPDDAGADIDLWRATELFAYDFGQPSSVAGSLTLARANARGLRETLASDVWEAINRTHHDLEAQIQSARSMGPHQFFRWVRERLALISGLIDTVVLHDDGWRFLTVGRCLERVDMTVRLIRGAATTADPAQWTAVLLSCGAYDAFLRTHGGSVTRDRALALLLQSDDLPRSITFALNSAGTCLQDLASGSGAHDAAIRIIGRARAEVAYAGPEAFGPASDDLLSSLQEACRQADELISAGYFRRADLIEWQAEFAT